MSLTWWQMTLWVVYTMYFLFRSARYWENTNEEKLWQGYRKTVFGYKATYFRVYHIVLILFDIPPAILGLTFPIIKKLLAFKIYEFADAKKYRLEREKELQKRGKERV